MLLGSARLVGPPVQCYQVDEFLLDYSDECVQLEALPHEVQQLEALPHDNLKLYPVKFNILKVTF